MYSVGCVATAWLVNVQHSRMRHPERMIKPTEELAVSILNATLLVFQNSSTLVCGRSTVSTKVRHRRRT